VVTDRARTERETGATLMAERILADRPGEPGDFFRHRLPAGRLGETAVKGHRIAWNRPGHADHAGTQAMREAGSQAS